MKILSVVFFVASVVVTACGSSSGSSASESTCDAVANGEVRSAVDQELGPHGGGGGNSSSCAVWWGDYDNGPCCSVRLTDCTQSGTVTSHSWDPTGCK